MHLSISTYLYVTVKDSIFYLLPLINWQFTHLSQPLFLWQCTFSYITVLDAFISSPHIMWLCMVQWCIFLSLPLRQINYCSSITNQKKWFVFLQFLTAFWKTCWKISTSFKIPDRMFKIEVYIRVRVVYKNHPYTYI